MEKKGREKNISPRCDFSCFFLLQNLSPKMFLRQPKCGKTKQRESIKNTNKMWNVNV